MNRIVTRLLTAAAALVVVTGIASAQTLKVDVPFAYHVGSAMYPAGSYRVVVDNAYRLVKIYNEQTGQASVILPASSESAPVAWRDKGEPVLGFECGLGRCTLAKIWTANGASAFNMPRPRVGRDEVATLRVIHAARVNGD